MLLDPTFYDAFREQGQLLVPERPVLLALVRLYSWLAANRQERFGEEKLREFLRQGEADALVGEAVASPYTPWQRYTITIRELQTYWLLRGVGAAAATYSLRPHARAFCKRLHTTLFAKLVVSQVEASFRLLRQGLAEDEETFDEETFLAWSRAFLPLSLDVEQQLTVLENDIETAVGQLRRHTSQSEDDFQLLIQQVDGTLEELLQQAQQLSRAFAHTTDLQTRLRHIWLANEAEQAAVNQAAREALDFMDRANHRLDELSERLGEVHTQVKTLFGSLNRRRFDRQTEQLLLLLLAAPPAREPRLPAGVPLARLAYRPLRFSRVPEASQAVLPTQPVTAPPRPVNLPAQAAFKAHTEEQLRRRGRVRYWLHELRQQLAPAGASVEFGLFGQRLAAEEGAATHEILTRLLAAVRRDDEPRLGWQLRIDATQEDLLENDFARFTLWKLTIHNP
jgi:hypothetical protein